MAGSAGGSGGRGRLRLAEGLVVGERLVLLRYGRLERLVELVGEALLGEEVVLLVFLGGGLVGEVGFLGGRGQARLACLRVEQLFVGRAGLLGGRLGGGGLRGGRVLGGGAGLQLGLDVEELGRLVGDDLALLGGGAGVDGLGGGGAGSVPLGSGSGAASSASAAGGAGIVSCSIAGCSSSAGASGAAAASGSGSA